MPHSVPCYGFVIWHKEIKNCLIFATDLEYCRFKFDKLKPSIIMVEANYSIDFVNKESENYSHVLGGHMEIQSSLDFILSNKTDTLQNVILLHLSQVNADKEMFLEKARQTVGDGVNVAIAEKGLEVEI